eukprot:12896951-Alexandrium_andersonii.AAC.1
MMGCLQTGEAPKLPQGACALLAQVWVRMPWCASFTIVEAEKEKHLQGKAAVEAAWNLCKQ